MFGASDRIAKLFADRFEPDGQDFLYRKKVADVPVRVTAAEREAFIADYRRMISRGYWITIVGTAVSIVIPIFFITTIPGLNGPYLMFALVAAVFAVNMSIISQAGNAPSIALRTRAPAGPAKSPEEARAIRLSKITWGNLGLGAVVVGVALFQGAAKVDLTAGWNRLWLVAATLYYALLAYRVYQKLRYGAGQATSVQ